MTHQLGQKPQPRPKEKWETGLEWVVGLRVLVLCETLWPHSWFPLNRLEQKLHVCPMKFPSVCWESKCWNDSSRLQSPLVRFFSKHVGLGSTLCGWRKVTVIYNEETPELLIQPWQPRGNCTRKDDILHIKYILQCVHPKSIQSCSTLCDPMDRSPPGSSVHGILQARVLEWVAILFSRGSSRPKDWSRVCSVSCVDKFFTRCRLGSPSWCTKSAFLFLVTHSRKCSFR